MDPDARATRLISDAKQLPHSTPPNGREGTRELFATPTGLPVTTPCNSAPHREHCAVRCAFASTWIVRTPDGRVSTFFRRPLVLSNCRLISFSSAFSSPSFFAFRTALVQAMYSRLELAIIL